MSLPVITFILGNPNYIYLTLNQASKFCENVVLIGDSSNKKESLLITHVDFGDLSSKKSELLKSIYTHRSTNPYSFDINCLLRWFYMETYMVKHNLERAIHMDPDVLIYEDITKTLYNLYKEDEVAYTIMERDYEFDWNCMGSVAYWTLEQLQKFTDFIIDYYQNKQTELDDLAEKYFKIKEFGGISDMTFLSLYQRKYSETVKNVALVHDKSFTFDSYFGTDQNSDLNEYRATKLSGIITKKVVFKDKKPVGFNLKFDKKVIFKTLHFQGQTKNLIIFYYTGNLNFIARMPYYFDALIFIVKKHVKKFLFRA